MVLQRFLSFSNQNFASKQEDELESLGIRRSKFWIYTAWFGCTFIAVGSIIYLIDLMVPDARVLRDSRHYYSTWKVKLHFVYHVFFILKPAL